jgi:RNA polymerase sigma factor (sigma-70 family)
MNPYRSIVCHAGGAVLPAASELSLVLLPDAAEQTEHHESDRDGDHGHLTRIETLGAGCKAGHPEAWDALFPIVWPVLVTFVHRLYRSFDEQDAEDIAQASLEAAIGGIATYSGRGLFRAWLFGIASRQAATFHRSRSARKRGHELRVPLDAAPDPRDYGIKSPDEVLSENDRAAILHEAIEELSEVDRELVHLHFFGELTFEQIGKARHMNPKSVYTRLTRCKRQLLVLLKRSDLTSCDG